MVKRIMVCSGPSCSSKGANSIIDELSRSTGVSVGASNSEYDLSRCGCLGHCYNSPNVMVDEEIVENVQLGDVKNEILLDQGQKAKKLEDYNADELIKDDFLNDI